MDDEIFKKGTFWERLTAFLIDQLILLLVVGAMMLLFLQPKDDVTNIISSLVVITYGTFFIWKSGRTPGKKLLKLKVIDSRSKPIGIGTAFLREGVGKFISMLILDLGYFWVMIDPKRQAWHDKIAKTYVVKTNAKGDFITIDDDEPITKAEKLTFYIGYFAVVVPLLLAAVFFAIYMYVAKPVHIEDEAMAPNYTTGQYFFANKVLYAFTQPKRGETILFTAPHDRSRELVKRIVGLPRETIAISDGRVISNGKPLDERAYLSQGTITYGSIFLKDNFQITIPENNYFVLGDNRQNSADSREWGFVPRQNIIGRIDLCYYQCEVSVK